jgi:hypothetical protein
MFPYLVSTESPLFMTEEANTMSMFLPYGILKRQVVRPMRNSLWVRDLLGIAFLKVPN